MSQPRLRLPALRDVAGVDDDSTHARVGQEVGDRGLDPAPGAVLVAGTVVDGRLCPRRLRHLGEDTLDPRRVTGVKEGSKRRADQVLGPEAEHPLDGRAHVADHASGVEDGDDVSGVLHQRAEALFAGAQRRLGRLTIGDVVAESEEARLTLQVDPLQREQDVPEFAGLGAERAVVVPHQLRDVHRVVLG